MAEGKKKRQTTEKVIKDTLSDLLGKLKVSAKKVEVEKGDQDNYSANIDTGESGLLIGFHGETINSLQLLLGVILYKKLEKWVRVVLDVGDYRQTRENSIRQMVNRIVAEVEQNSNPVTLPYLTPFERRIVHLMLADHKKITSQSQGEGRDRRVVIKPRE